MHYNVIIQKKIRKTRRCCAADKYDANGFPGNGGSEKSEVNGMATYYDDTEYERRGGGFWGKFLAVFLGFCSALSAPSADSRAWGMFYTPR